MDEFAEALQKSGINVRVASDAAQVAGWVHSGNYALNYAMSGRFLRGYPLGHVVEIYGWESSGKSFVVARAISEMQKSGGKAIIDDTEGALNDEWFRLQLEVDTESLLYDRTDTVEQHFEFVKAIIDASDKQDDPTPILVALDSASLLSTEHEMKVGLDKPSLNKAKKLHAFCRILGKKIHDRPIVYLATNHVYDNVGASPWEPKTKSSGGGAFKYESSVRISMRTPKKIKKGSNQVGVIVRAVVEKTRFTPPYKEAEIAIPFESPIADESGLIPVLLDIGVLEMDGHALSYEGEDTGIKAHKTSKLKQDESAKELLEEFPDILEKADEMLDNKQEEIFGGSSLSGAEVEEE